MAGAMTVDFRGGRELEIALAALASRATRRNAARRALLQAAVPIQELAVRLAPDDPRTGEGRYLRESIKIGTRADKSVMTLLPQGPEVVQVFIGIDGSVLPPHNAKTRRSRRGRSLQARGSGVAAYSIFQEMGTSSMAAQPYLRPAFEHRKAVAVSQLGTALWDEIDKAAARAARKQMRLMAAGA